LHEVQSSAACTADFSYILHFPAACEVSCPKHNRITIIIRTERLTINRPHTNVPRRAATPFTIARPPDFQPASLPTLTRAFSPCSRLILPQGPNPQKGERQGLVALRNAVRVMQIVEPFHRDDSGFSGKMSKLGVGVRREGIGASTNLIVLEGRGSRRIVSAFLLLCSGPEGVYCGCLLAQRGGQGALICNG
jgi:hypothetical protein